MTKKVINNSQGFTIIELLIATIIFSVMLLICATSINYITRTYVKGEVTIQTTDTARSIINSLSQDIEFSSYATIENQVAALSAPTNNGDNYSLCLGSHVYYFRLDAELDGNQPEANEFSPHDLFVGSYSGACPSTSASQMENSPTGVYTSNYQELLDQHMRLGHLGVTQLKDANGNLRNAFQLDVTLAYGDDDIVGKLPASSWGGARQPPSGSTWNLPTGPTFNYSCLANTVGGQFCSVVTLTAVASSRIN